MASPQEPPPPAAPQPPEADRPPPGAATAPPPEQPVEFVSPWPPLAGILNVLFAFVWSAGAALHWFPTAEFVCFVPAAAAFLGAWVCFKRASWWAALVLSVLGANAMSTILVLLSREDFPRPASTVPAP